MQHFRPDTAGIEWFIRDPEELCDGRTDLGGPDLVPRHQDMLHRFRLFTSSLYALVKVVGRQDTF
jgi:hypothetical protein